MMSIFLFLLINSVSLDSCNGFCWTTNCETETPKPPRRASIIEDLTDTTKKLIRRLKLIDARTTARPSVEQTSLDIETDAPNPNVLNNSVASETASPRYEIPMQLSDVSNKGPIINATQIQIETYAPSPSVLNSAVSSKSMSPSSEAPMRLSDTPSIAPTANSSLLQIETDVSGTNVQNSTVSQPSTVSPSTTDIVYGWLMTIFPKISAFLSMIGSAMVITSVAKSKKNRGNIQQRIVGAMSCVDFIASVTWFLTPLFMQPSFKERVPFVLGNETTCDVQGFLIQFVTASFLYSASLSIYYVLIIKYNWPTDRMKKLEKYLHICPLGWSLITATISLSLGIFGDATWDCWIESQYPVYQWVFTFIPLMTSLGINIFNMAQIYYYVKSIEDKAAKYKRTSVRAITHKNSLKIAEQNKFYVISFISTWLLLVIARILQIVGSIQLPPWFTVMCVFMVYFQGFVHAIVYYRPRFQNFAKDYPDKYLIWVIYQFLFKTMLPCLYNDSSNDGNNDDGEDIISLRDSNANDENNVNA